MQLSAFHEDRRGEVGREEWGGSEEGETECEDETCEHCRLEQFNARAAQLRRTQERAADDAAMRAHKIAVQALEENEQVCPLSLTLLFSPLCINNIFPLFFFLLFFFFFEIDGGQITKGKERGG